jgi:hypothetical protein
MATPGKLTVGSDGKVRGQASIGYSTPFPVPNGHTPGGSGLFISAGRAAALAWMPRWSNPRTR